MRKGATTAKTETRKCTEIVALRNEKGSYNAFRPLWAINCIVALRNEKGSYNKARPMVSAPVIVALRNEKGSYNRT